MVVPFKISFYIMLAYRDFAPKIEDLMSAIISSEKSMLTQVHEN